MRVCAACLFSSLATWIEHVYVDEIWIWMGKHQVIFDAHMLRWLILKHKTHEKKKWNLITAMGELGICSWYQTWALRFFAHRRRRKVLRNENNNYIYYYRTPSHKSPANSTTRRCFKDTISQVFSFLLFFHTEMLYSMDNKFYFTFLFVSLCSDRANISSTTKLKFW